MNSSMGNRDVTSAAILGICIAIGLSVIGIGGSIALHRAKTADRFVTVRGLAEREVDADLAIWPLTFKVADNDLASLQGQIDRQRRLIVSFLEESGFEPESISFASPRISDTQADQYGQPRGPYRYIAQSTVTVRTSNVALVRQTMESTGNLVGVGVVLVADNWDSPTEFLFTALNDIKPEMIEEATKNARAAAEKFAVDSGSQVGGIRRATQGLFSIEDRDRNSPERKVVRVVTTVEYFLR
jgi:uncharacterized protein